MGFIEVAIAEAKEPEIMPEGPFQLIIKEAKGYRNDSSGKDSVMCIIGFEEHPEAGNILHFVALPHETDDADKRNNKLLMIKKFLEMFDIPFEGHGFNMEDFSGCTGRVFVNQEADQNGVMRNNVTFKKVS